MVVIVIEHDADPSLEDVGVRARQVPDAADGRGFQIPPAAVSSGTAGRSAVFASAAAYGTLFSFLQPSLSSFCTGALEIRVRPEAFGRVKNERGKRRLHGLVSLF